MNEQQQDGHLIHYPAALPLGRPKLLIHVNGVTSSCSQQLRDLEALVWLTLDHPFDVIGVHNSTEGFQGDMLESLLGKAELFRFWPENYTAQSQNRLQGYARLLFQLSSQELAPNVDILNVLEAGGGANRRDPLLFDLGLIRRLSFVQQMGWGEFESYFYGVYPAGAPRPTLRLAYELVRGIRAGAEIFVVAHSQGMIIAAIAFHILQQFFGEYDKWVEKIRLIGYGPVIMFEDLPLPLRSQTVMIQHRHDLVADALSNIRNVSAWSNLQTQMKNLLERAEGLVRLINTDSHHSASLYLGLQGGDSSQRSAKLLNLLLSQAWEESPAIAALRGSRIILEESATEILTPATSSPPAP